jgi:glycerol dehydrogenase-like iron-containing ADH family enzyme
MRRLVHTLVLSGFRMTLCDGSDPASQGEHLLSRYVDAMRPPDLPEASWPALTIAMSRPARIAW